MKEVILFLFISMASNDVQVERISSYEDIKSCEKAAGTIEPIIVNEMEAMSRERSASNAGYHVHIRHKCVPI